MKWKVFALFCLGFTWNALKADEAIGFLPIRAGGIAGNIISLPMPRG